MGVHRGVRRISLREAAQLLGVSKDAVRQRIRRGTIESEKGEDGRVYVYVDTSTYTSARTQADHAGHAYPQAEGRRHADPAPLVEELRDQVGYLRDQLRREQDAHAEARRIIAALTQRIPEIEASASGASTPPEPPGEPSEATPQPGRVGPQAPLEEAPSEGSQQMHMPEAGGGPLPRDQREAASRPWWRRMFGG